EEAGKIMGRHKGRGHDTIGQRKGLGMAFGEPMYVKEINAAANRVVLSKEDALFRRDMLVEDVNFMSHDGIEGEMRCLGKIRYSHKSAPCTIKNRDGRIQCVFDTPQRAITPGQSAVFYDDNGRIICGGVIV
ncbi:MAG: tRNA 2-thiouridine(34) synthase MnmA, partial [Defluviitaleaceae bacterium]|nr:tRNA 2-thiouridine(34) synthase MnmA [Defluviitaleaceae bacterium]